MKDPVQMPESRFLRVACRKCRNDQIVFNKASTVVNCLKCGAELLAPTGGTAEIKGRAARTFT
ncbi:MAG: 30S ribosomal protein S27e [Candidatus Aenigmarchaeota archaeon]|nr:30S ribosomal protein S27e [Candidatus Aenigmarchaeota archaeon]